MRTDDEVVAYIADRFGGEVLLLPRATGVDALIWVLPVVLTVVKYTENTGEALVTKRLVR